MLRADVAGQYTIVTKLLFAKKKGQKVDILLKEDVHGNRAKKIYWNVR